MSYRIGRELGSGALGRVVEIHDDDAGRVWAGKILHASQRGDERARRRFEAEAKLLAGVVHPNLIAVEGLVSIEVAGVAEPVLLMELVTGSDLAHLIAAEAPLPPARVAELGRGIAAGLGEAHRAGLVHRDLKPSNVLLAADGTPKVADFGLARAASFAASGADAAAVAGTPDYMAPEAIDPLAVDVRTDLYALGCILCELATGTPPYAGATAFAILAAHRTAPLPSLPDVPDELARTIRWLLAKSPADRPQSADEVSSALGAVDGAGTRALALASPEERGARACSRCGALGPAVVGVCFACGLPSLELARGDTTVFVVGPGEQTHKLDAELRLRLLDWLARNAALGLDARQLARETPRLPFALVSDVDAVSAAALATELERLGFRAITRRGGALALREVRAKGWTLAGRVIAIGATSSFYMLRHSLVVAVVSVVAIGLGGLISGFRQAGRRAARLVAGKPRAALPSSFDGALARVSAVVPAMTAARHRDALRGVVERSLALRDVLGPEARASAEPELAGLIDLAALASSRLDQLESELSPEDLRGGDDTARARWRTRDLWAGKLLAVTGFLDAMRARAVMAKGKLVGQADLADLRAQVAALGEIA